MNKKIRRLLLKMLIKNEHDVVKKKEETYQLLRPRTNQQTIIHTHIMISLEKNVKLIKSFVLIIDSSIEVPHS